MRICLTVVVVVLFSVWSGASGCASDGGTAQDVVDDVAVDTSADDAVADDVGGDSASDDTDAATVDTAQGDTHEPVGTITLGLTLLELATNTPLGGATVTAGDATGVTATDGTLSIEVPADADVTLTVTGDEMRDHLLNFHTGVEAEQRTYELVVDGIVAAFEATLGGTFDDARGNAMIRVEDAAGQPISGMEITTDSAAEVAIVVYESSPSGVGLGNTTEEGPLAAILFANMQPGQVTPAFSHPSSYTCSGVSPLDVPAGAIVFGDYRCTLE